MSNLLAEALVKATRLAFRQLFIILLSLFGSQAGDCSVLVTIVFDEVRTKILCIHTKLIVVCRRLRQQEKRDCS